jgi:ribosomal 50S subunit-recycling heat shock protein
VRIDLALKHVCLAKSRSIAKALCDEGRVTINGKPAQASTTIRAGDRVRIRFPERPLEIEILDLPLKQASKTDAPRHYRVLSEN